MDAAIDGDRDDSSTCDPRMSLTALQAWHILAESQYIFPYFDSAGTSCTMQKRLNNSATFSDKSMDTKLKDCCHVPSSISAGAVKKRRSSGWLLALLQHHDWRRLAEHAYTRVHLQAADLILLSISLQSSKHADDVSIHKRTPGLRPQTFAVFLTSLTGFLGGGGGGCTKPS